MRGLFSCIPILKVLFFIKRYYGSWGLNFCVKLIRYVAAKHTTIAWLVDGNTKMFSRCYPSTPKFSMLNGPNSGIRRQASLNEFLVITLLVLLQLSKKAKQNGMSP